MHVGAKTFNDVVISESNLNKASPGRWQFTTRQILVTLTVVACLLGLFRWSNWPLGSTLVCCVLVAAAAILPRNARNCLLVILVCTYLPYTWSLWDEFPWGHNWKGWQENPLGIWPILPALIPLHGIRGHGSDEFVSDAVVTLIFVTIATALATKHKWLLVITVLIVCALSLFNAFITGHALYAG